MTEEIKINNVENFVNIEVTEISDISKIIQQMIEIKKTDIKSSGKKTKPYSVIDKIKLNEISMNTSVLIHKYHVEAYDIIEDAIGCLSKYEPCIANDLFDYYFEIYIDVLDEMKISYDDTIKIKENSDEIYKSVMLKVREKIYLNKKTEIALNKQQTYISAITAYVFYKCKFLIAIE